MSLARAVPPSSMVVAYPFLVAAAEVTAAAWWGAGVFAAADPVSLGVLVLAGVTSFLTWWSTHRHGGQHSTIEGRAQTTAEHAQRLAELEATAESVGRDRAYWETRAHTVEERLSQETSEHLVTRRELHKVRREAIECEARLEVATEALRLARARITTLEADAEGTGA